MPLLATIPRAEFLACYFDYAPGEHLAMWEPTGQGKTHLAYQLLDVAMRQNPGLRVMSVMPKSRSPATRRWAERLDLAVTGRWPPPPRLGRRPRGHVLWPRHLAGAPVRQDREHVAGIIRPALHDQFRRGSSITLADDAFLLAVTLNLNLELEELLTSGAEGGAGLWLAAQKATGTRQGSITSYALNSPAHLFLGWDPYAANVHRNDDISGVDMHLVARVVPQLRRHRIATPDGPKNVSEKLYIRKDGPYMAIIGP